jgi:hypothetical protein
MKHFIPHQKVTVTIIRSKSLIKNKLWLYILYDLAFLDYARNFEHISVNFEKDEDERGDRTL